MSHLLLQDPFGSWVGSKFYLLLCFDMLIYFQASSYLSVFRLLHLSKIISQFTSYSVHNLF